ncbi:MAG: hypothetical protein EVA57_04065 [alpha proteobacterium HIMB59]|nr:MAG: hypothetical protein EVA57_04065 [alpha proteobacterium HIMB59]
MKTILIIDGNKNILKYQRKMPQAEVIKMKSFVTSKGQKLEKTQKFKILNITDQKDQRIFETNL